MANKIITESQSDNKVWAAKLSILFALLSVLALLSLHFLSPGFAPSWRMVSEYANGKFEWVLFIFFSCWGISSWCTAYLLWSYVTSKAGKAGVILLFISGAGEILAAFFNVNHPQHGTAGTLGIPTFVIASLLISYHLKKRDEWKKNKTILLWAAHATWISVVLVVITMVIMINGFKNAGIIIGPDQKPPAVLPDGVVALAGYANRILIVAYIFWLLFVSNNYLKIFNAKPGLVRL
jgi:Protein of unknown function (DUF998)